MCSIRCMSEIGLPLQFVSTSDMSVSVRINLSFKVM